MEKQLKVISNPNDLIGLDFTAVRISPAQIDFFLDGKQIHSWVEPLLESDDDIWYAFAVNGKSYDVNFYAEDEDIERVSFYGMYTYAEDPNHEDAHWVTDHSDWHSIDVINKVNV